MAEILSLKIQDARVLGLLRDMPQYLSAGLAAAAIRAGQRFLSFHRRERLSAKNVATEGPLAATGAQRKVGQPVGKGFVGRRIFGIQGSTLDNLVLTLRVPGAAPSIHEKGGVVRSKSGPIRVPLRSAKNSKGKLATFAKNLLRDTRHVAQAATAGQSLFRKGKRVHGLVWFQAKDGREYLARLRPGKTGRERLQPLFIYKGEAHVKPRFEFFASWERFRPKANEIFRQALPYAIRAAARKRNATVAPGLLLTREVA